MSKPRYAFICRRRAIITHCRLAVFPLVAQLLGCDSPEPVWIDGACRLAVIAVPERGVVMLGDTLTFSATHLRECSVQVPFAWSTIPASAGVFVARSDTSAVFTAQELGLALVRIDDPNGKLVGQASVEVTGAGTVTGR